MPLRSRKSVGRNARGREERPDPPRDRGKTVLPDQGFLEYPGLSGLWPRLSSKSEKIGSRCRITSSDKNQWKDECGCFVPPRPKPAAPRREPKGSQPDGIQKKPFSRQMIRKLAAYFGVDVGVLAASI